MSKLSLSQRLTGWFPTSLEQPFISDDDNNIATIGVIAPELLDRITDHLHDDRRTLLLLGLASKQTLIRSRLHLFSELEFIKDSDREFDVFLALLEVPWTSFANAVESLHIKELFHPRGYKHLPNKNMPRILANLPNLKTLRLTSMSWAYIPPHIRDFFFQTNIADVQLDSVEFTTYQQIDIVELFVRLRPSIKSITLYNLQFDDVEIPNLSQHSSTFQRRIHLTSFDTSSLLLFKDVWDPLRSTNNHDITVESFHVRLVPMTRSDREAYTPFISRFLRQVGPSLHHIFLKLSDPYLDTSALPYYDSVDLSQCINVRMVHVGTITLDRISRSGEEMSPMLSTMWKSLSTLPSHSPSLEGIVLIFRPFSETPEGGAAELEIFAWLDLVGRLQEMFPNLKTITVGVGYYAVDDENPAPYVTALRRAPGIRELEARGILLLYMIPWQSYGSPDPAWKETMRSL